MPVSIQRLRYYDGEYLRSFDWTAEQTYHLEMRRRLHLAMNLWGIAYGLKIITDTEGTVKTFSIGTGAAIDAYGREIFVFNPYQLDDSFLTNNLISKPDNYQLLVRYRVDAGTPPSAGYGQCNGSNGLNQSTRWNERFDVILQPQSWNLPSPEPLPTDALSENAKIDQWAVPLGTVTVGFAPDGKTLVVQNATEINRRYLGTRTQRIESPEDATSDFDIKKAQTPLDPPASVEIASNLYVPQNLVVGDNFAINALSGSPPPTGNVKIAGDLLLQGSIFVWDSTALAWKSLQSLAPPQFVQNVAQVDMPAPGGVDPSTGTSPDILVNTTFPTGEFDVQVSASIAGVIWRDHSTVDAVRTALGAGDTDAAYKVTANKGIVPTGVNVSFTWSIAPVKSSGGTFTSAIKTIFVNYLVIFTPKP